MSYPILYNATETNFEHNGIGILSSCVSCVVTEEANGIFELDMQYPMDGVHFSEIADRSIIKAKADQFREPQLFRVYAVSRPMSGVVTVLAEHISYDLSGIPVKPFSTGSAALALAGLRSNAVVDCPFEFWTDKATIGNFSVSTPSSIRSRLGGVTGSVLDVYGGEYEFDNFTVKLHNKRGVNRGVSIRYGKNLTDIKQDQNCSSVATGVYPYWSGYADDDTVLVELPEKIVNAPGTYNFVKIRTLDLSSEFDAQPTVEQLRARTESYIKANNIGVPSVSLTVSFAQLEQYDEYKHLKLLERVGLFDTISVEFPTLGVSADAKAVKVSYDVLADRVKSVTLGSVRANIADTIANQQQEIQKAPTKSDLERAKEAATSWLTNGKGYAYFRKDEYGNIIDILFMDTQDPLTSVNVMRVGQSGIGFSHNGVNGPYESAWTIDGKFNADWIYSGTLYGILFKAGLIESINGKIKIDLSRDEDIPVFNTGISTNGLVVRSDDSGVSDLVRILAEKGSLGNQDWYGVVEFNSANGTRLATLLETFNSDYTEPVGVAMYLYNQAHDKSLIFEAADHARILLQNGSNTAGSFYVGPDGNGCVYVFNSNGTAVGYLIARNEGGDLCISNSDKSKKTRIVGDENRMGVWLYNGDVAVGSFLVGSDGNPVLTTTKINGKTVSWKDNGDGTFALIGT